MLMDCGSGTLHGLDRDGLPWKELTHILISHFHADHIGDLVPVLWALKWGRPGPGVERLRIVGPRGLTRRMEGFSVAFGAWVLDPGFPLELHELEPGDAWQDEKVGLLVEATAARHSPEALCLRVEARGAQVGYTGDTGALGSLAPFLRGVDLLVAECAVPDPNELDMHLSPNELAPLAERSGPELLVTVHHYPGLDLRRLPDLLRAAGYSGRILVGRDGLALAVGPSEVRLLRDLPR